MTPRLTCQRGNFILPEGLHYLNCAYMSPLPRPVEEAILGGVRIKRDSSRLSVGDFFDPVEEVRRRFARVLGPTGGRSSERVAVFPSVSYGISLCARNLPVERGGRIVVTAEQFPGNVYAWLRSARRPPLRRGRGGQLRPPARDPGFAALEDVLEETLAKV